MTKSKSRRKPSRPHYHVHRRPGRKKSHGIRRFVPPPMAYARKGIREKRHPKRSFPKVQDSITNNQELIMNTDVKVPTDEFKSDGGQQEPTRSRAAINPHKTGDARMMKAKDQEETVGAEVGGESVHRRQGSAMENLLEFCVNGATWLKMNRFRSKDTVVEDQNPGLVKHTDG
jgi:hypothetical protein